MTSKDVTRVFGSIRFVLPLLSIFLIAAGSAIACPEHKTKAAYRTKAINTRTVSHMAPVVITYGGSASYQRCADQFGTRRVKNVSRQVAYDHVGSRYVVIRNVAPQTRVIALRDNVPQTRFVLDYEDDAPRYISVRRQHVYVEPAPRYIAVRNDATRARYVAPRDIDFEDAPQAVAVNNIETDFEVEAPRARHVVVKTDDLTGTEEVIHSSPGNDDTAYVAPPIEDIDTTDASSTPVAYSIGNHVYDDTDVDYRADLYNHGLTYVADDMEACLPDVVDTSPELVTTRAVNYVPMDDVDNDAVVMGTDVTYVHDDDGFSVRYRPLVDDEDIIEPDTAFVVEDDEDLGDSTVSYVPVEDVDDVDVMAASYSEVEPVSYIAVDDIDDVDVMAASYDEAEPVSYIAVDDIDDVDVLSASEDQAESLSDAPVETVTYIPVDTSGMVCECN